MTKAKKRSMTEGKNDFSFGTIANDFEFHIETSISGYKTRLIPDCLRQAVRFVQPGTNVYDVGCATGYLLESVHRITIASRPLVNYQGIDIERKFMAWWINRVGLHLHFDVRDALHYEFKNASLIYSLFTVQFLRPADKAVLLKRLCDSLVEGGALIIAEKTLAETPRLQETLNSQYFDYKRSSGLSATQILDKDCALHGQMTCLTEAELRSALRQAGFRELTSFWRESFFVGYLALK
jgi:tRNA (cmo5U34)-methyltransferase